MYIEIVKAPSGETPQWVRDAWVGLRIKCLNPEPVEMRTAGVMSGPKSLFGQIMHAVAGKTEIKRGYVVKARDVVGVLSLSNEAAAQWWIDHTPHVLNETQVFLFEESCCRPIRIH